jgi:hypothetical protein
LVKSGDVGMSPTTRTGINDQGEVAMTSATSKRNGRGAGREGDGSSDQHVLNPRGRTDHGAAL